MFSKAALLALALPAYCAVHESLRGLPLGWSEASDIEVADNTPIQLNVALQYQNLDQLEPKLASLSTPGSPDYGKWMDIDEMNAMFAPSKDSEDSVVSWLSGEGVQDISSDGNTVSFVTTVGHANSLLQTQFKVYTDGETNRLRTLGYSVPDHLADSIDLISPTTYFGNMKAHGVARTRPSKTEFQAPTKRQFQTSCETTVSVQVSANETMDFALIGPQCLKELYNIGDYSVDVSAGSTIAFGSFLNQSASYSDLAMFEQIFNIPSQNFTVLALINGGVDNQDPVTEMDGEANLDCQNMIGLVDGLPVGEYITGGLPPFIPDLISPNASTESNEPYLQYYQYLLSQPNSNLPYVISNSYGDHEETVPEYYAKRVCNMIGMMGMRGRTIFESSGDEGTGAECRNNQPPYNPRFTVQFPGTCPYVTAVGGTQFYNPEAAWNASSGGFSNYFPIAWYQQDAVNTYLNEYINPVAKEYYESNDYANLSGRGVPDISAHSLYPDYLTVINGTAEPNGGTSAASPVVASVFALLNDARFRAGMPSMGFVNPWLYSMGYQGLNDITTGAALGCAGVDLQNGDVIAGAGIIPYASWNATEGWDPVTGLGTPNFMELKTLALQANSSGNGGGWGNW